MLTYINENFLHAPSTDLSREVIKFLVSVIMAQATEVFFEKCTDEKKGHALVSKIGAQAASMYNSLAEEVKEFMGKGIFDRNLVTLIQVRLFVNDGSIFILTMDVDKSEIFYLTFAILSCFSRQHCCKIWGRPRTVHPR
jgi:hypothetical protein